ncbi:hypothetical protein [Pararhizobium polonicum]|nr:hypothetical protein [Pararhizobium polonicum]
MSGAIRCGFDHVILPGQPHPEAVRHFGEGTTARLRTDGRLAPFSP